MADAIAEGVTVELRAGAALRHAAQPEDLAEPGTKIPRRGLTRNRHLGRDVPVAVEAISRESEAHRWRVRVSMDGMAWDEMAPARVTRDEAVEIAWRELTLRAARILPAQEV